MEYISVCVHCTFFDLIYMTLMSLNRLTAIFRQNLNSDFTDSALGSSDKSPLPYGNFQLRDTTVQSILNHPRYGPKSPLGSNMYTYLKFGLPRVFPPNNDSQRSSHHPVSRNNRGNVNRGYRNSSVQGFSGGNGGSSGYDSSDNETTKARQTQNLRKFRSESDFRMLAGAHNTSRPSSRAHGHVGNVSAAALRKPNSRASIAGTQMNSYMEGRQYGHRSHSEADLLSNDHNRLEYETR